MTSVFSTKLGPGWLEKIATGEKIAAWNSKMNVESKKRLTRGVAVVSTQPLDYADFPTLVDIAKKHWKLLTPALGKMVTASLLDRFDDLRNTVAHSRPLLSFEADLLAGIAGEIRNRVTLYMSTKDPVGDTYPRIESISDNLGFGADAAETLRTPSTSIRTSVTLEIGQAVTYDCHGSDPQGRDIRWELTIQPPGGTPTTMIGDHVLLSWAVDERHVSGETVVQIRMISSGFHRWGSSQVDGIALYYYRVRPPS